jgi:AbrB family looped-hinge helix DNA binding protein
MSYFRNIGIKSRLTVPPEICKRLRLNPGDRVEFVVEEGRAVIRPARSEVNPFEKYIGITGPFPGGEGEIKAWIDDMRSDRDYQ